MAVTTKTVLQINDADETKGLAPARKMLQESGLPETDENVFIAATCKEKGITFLKGEARLGIRLKEKAVPAAADDKPSAYTVTINGKAYTVQMGDGSAQVNGKNYSVDIAAGGTAAAAAPAVGEAKPVTSQMPGAVLRIDVSVGDVVSEGDTLLVMEAMKMEVEVKAPGAGTVSAIPVSVGDQVQSGGTLVEIS